MSKKIRTLTVPQIKHPKYKDKSKHNLCRDVRDKFQNGNQTVNDRLPNAIFKYKSRRAEANANAI